MHSSSFVCLRYSCKHRLEVYFSWIQDILTLRFKCAVNRLKLWTCSLYLIRYVSKKQLKSSLLPIPTFLVSEIMCQLSTINILETYWLTKYFLRKSCKVAQCDEGD